MDNPLFKKLPKIGIRPAIDGRLGGVRESLETQTMNLAKSVARLVGEKLRYPNGKPVQCVIADRCLRGKIRAGRCRCFAHRHSLLVLRQ
jgi:L-fucose isomerase